MNSVKSLVGLVSVIAISSGAYADKKDDVSAAARKLADRSSYRWSSTTRSDGAGPFGGSSSTTGQLDADGNLWVSSKSQQTSSEFARRQDKLAVVVDGNWMTAEQAAERSPAGRGRGGPPGGLNARSAANFNTPIAQVEELLAKATNFKQDGELVTAELPTEAAAELLNAGAQDRRGGRGQRGGRGGRGSRGAPSTRDAKGTLTFKIKDGLLAEYTVEASATRQFGENEVKQVRTTTTTFAAADAAQTSLPNDAKEIRDALASGRTPKVFVPEPCVK